MNMHFSYAQVGSVVAMLAIYAFKPGTMFLPAVVATAFVTSGSTGGSVAISPLMAIGCVIAALVAWWYGNTPDDADPADIFGNGLDRLVSTWDLLVPALILVFALMVSRYSGNALLAGGENPFWGAESTVEPVREQPAARRVLAGNPFWPGRGTATPARA